VRDSLHTAVRAACAAAKLDPAQIESTCVGLSGAGRPEVRDVVARIMTEIIRGRVLVVGDIEIAMQAAFGGGPGVITIAGTGSIAYGRDLQGRIARSGGWGLAISDEGSGQWIGRAAVSAALARKTPAQTLNCCSPSSNCGSSRPWTIWYVTPTHHPRPIFLASFHWCWRLPMQAIRWLVRFWAVREGSLRDWQAASSAGCLPVWPASQWPWWGSLSSVGGRARGFLQ